MPVRKGGKVQYSTGDLVVFLTRHGYIRHWPTAQLSITQTQTETETEWLTELRFYIPLDTVNASCTRQRWWRGRFSRPVFQPTRKNILSDTPHLVRHATHPPDTFCCTSTADCPENKYCLPDAHCHALHLSLGTIYLLTSCCVTANLALKKTFKDIPF